VVGVQEKRPYGAKTHNLTGAAMNKKLWMGVIGVFIAGEILMFLIHGVILDSAYRSVQGVWRADMESLMWIYHVLAIIGAFFFTFIFSKGYEGKGVAEGVRYGLYIGIWMSLGMAYGSYAMIDIPYSLALQWFIYGVVEYIILGIVVAWIYGMKPKEAASA
jgi:hypothetical protein